MYQYKDILDVTRNKLKNKIIYPWVPRLGIEDTKREELWQKMFDLKVHGLCTNYPRELKQWLAKKVG